MQQTPLDAIPDLSDVQVIIRTEWPGRSPDLIEDQITYPIVTALVPTPGVRVGPGIHRFRRSRTSTSIFEDGTDVYWARSRVLEYLQSLRAALPDGVTPTMGPDATGVGLGVPIRARGRKRRHTRSTSCAVFRIGRCATAWQAFLAWRRSQASAASSSSIRSTWTRIGSSAYDLSTQAGGRCDSREQQRRRRTACSSSPGASTWCGRADTCTSIADIEQIVARDGHEGHPGPRRRRRRRPHRPRYAPRRGRARRTRRSVGGIIIMRFRRERAARDRRREGQVGGDPADLPAGVTILPDLRSVDLIEARSPRCAASSIEETIVVSLVVIVFLFHFRSALIPIVTFPIAILAVLHPVWYLGVSANIMSLGGHGTRHWRARRCLDCDGGKRATVSVVEEAHPIESRDQLDCRETRPARLAVRCSSASR